MPTKPDERRREELLVGLEAHMLKQGFADWRVGNLAARFHCSRSTLYALAPSKDELILLLVYRYAHAARMAAESEARGEESPDEAIIRYTEVIHRWQKRGSMRFWEDMAGNNAAAAIVDAKSDRGIDFIRSLLDAGVERGEFRPANTVFVANMVWRAAATTRDSALLQRCGLSAGEAMQELGRLIVFGMGWPHNHSGLRPQVPQG